MPERAAEPLSPEAFAAAAGVSRETLARLSALVDLLGQWQRRINLVSASTLRDVWRRHIFDSAQLFPLLPRPDARVYDIGSGAGFPGLVLAVLGASQVHLIESDHRKAAFLREASRITGAPTTIHVCRAGTLAPRDGDVVTARACAALSELLDLSAPLLTPAGICLFLKGRGIDAELTAATETWKMRAARIPSRTDPTGVILRLEDLHHV
ncbi:MAG: 16S rRNA (guanine(527)-N(7))-methyltransferase RsmG [Alphaproteobacteria bacterium]|nr:16S rRNA (guanine(527)-N(7))-methyltransferase RsmG [Alphaproteobacteria bacterium]